jgi:hypothetical protein
MSYYVDPGGIVIDTLEINGLAYSPGGGPGGNGYSIELVLLESPIFYQPLIFGGGLADLFCAKAVPDTFYARPVPDIFTVPPGKTSC